MALQRFSPEIRAEMQATQAALRSLQTTWPAGIEFTNVARVSIFDCLPHLFLPAFSPLPPATIRAFAVALRLFANSIFLADTVMDRNVTSIDATGAELRVQALQFEAYQIFHELFPPKAPFWARFKGYMAENTDAILMEQHFADDERWSGFTEEVALRVAAGKAALVKAAVAGLAELAGEDPFVAALELTIREYSVARQMFDDLCDWKEDVVRGAPTLLVSRACRSRPRLPDPEGKEQALRLIARDLYYRGNHLRYVIDLSLRKLDEAEVAIAPLPRLPWHEVIAELRQTIQALGSDVDRIVDRNLRGAAAQGERARPRAEGTPRTS